MEDRIQKLDHLIVHDPTLGPGLFAQLRLAQRELGLLQGDRATCPFLRPHLMPRREYETVKRAAETLAGAFEKIATAALDDEALLAVLDLTEAEEKVARIDPGYSRLCVCSRLDAIVSAKGFQFLEYNAAGVGDQMQLEKILFRLPAMKQFLEANTHWLPQPHRALLTSLLKTYREWGGEEDKPRIAIVDWEGVPTSSEFRILKDYFVAHRYPAVIADSHDLKYNGDYLSVDGFRIDILYKRVVIHEFLSKFDLDHPLVQAYRRGRVCMANSFRTKLAHKKSTFAVCNRRWPKGTEVGLVVVVDTVMPLTSNPSEPAAMKWIEVANESNWPEVRKTFEPYARKLRSAGLHAEVLIRRGSPADEILEEGSSPAVANSEGTSTLACTV